MSTEKNLKASELCPSPHIESRELEGDTVVTIKSVSKALVGKEKANKAIISFEEFDRPMVLNKTNSVRIWDMYGIQTADWIGKQITIYPSETDYDGKTVPCIRVREKK